MSPDLNTLSLRVTDLVPDTMRITTCSLNEIDDRDLARRTIEAYENGERAGYQRAVEQASGALSAAGERLDEAREKAEGELAEVAIDLALRIAREILSREIDEGRYDIEQVVRQALSWSGVGRGNCIVHLNPEDVARLQGIPFRAGTTLEGDADVARGDVHITTPQGLLVRELEECLDAVRASLNEELS